MSEELESITADVESFMARIKQKAPDRAESKAKLRRSPDLTVLLKNAKYPDRHRENLRKMFGPGLVKARALLPTVLEGDCLLILFGVRGPGKTQIATWLAMERLRCGKSAGIYAKCADIFTEIKRTWDNNGKTIGTEHDILERYRRTPFLVIDEVHEISGTKGDWHQRTLINILDHRYDSRLCTILIGNYGWDRVKEEINPSILSRAEETGGLVHCDWASYRSIAA